MDEEVTVKAHQRTIREAFGKPLASPVTFDVPSFSRQMNMPKREFLGLSIDDEAELLAQAEDYAINAWGEPE